MTNITQPFSVLPQSCYDSTLPAGFSTVLPLCVSSQISLVQLIHMEPTLFSLDSNCGIPHIECTMTRMNQSQRSANDSGCTMGEVEKKKVFFLFFQKLLRNANT